jgi:hypothetical protein
MRHEFTSKRNNELNLNAEDCEFHLFHRQPELNDDPLSATNNFASEVLQRDAPEGVRQ